MLFNFDFKKMIYTIYMAVYKFLMKLCVTMELKYPTLNLCIFLKRYAYPFRYSDLTHRFARPVPELCIINSFVLTFLYERWGHLFTAINQQRLSPNNLQLFANPIHDKVAPLENCWGL